MLIINISYFIQNVNRNLKFLSKLNLLVCSDYKGKFVNVCIDDTSMSVLLFCCYMENELRELAGELVKWCYFFENDVILQFCVIHQIYCLI